MNYKKNDLVHLIIDGMNDLGNGVAHPDNFAVFVIGGVIGDEVTAKIIKVTASYAVATVTEIVSPSHDRIVNTCPSKGCGGCAYRLLSYDAELRMKEDDVRFAFKKAGLADTVILPVLTTGKTDGYRNKAQYPVALAPNGKMIAGFYAPKSHRVVEASDCPLQPPLFSRMVKWFMDFAGKCGITAYDEESGRGCLRHLYFRTNRDESEILLTVVINGKKMPCEERLASEMPKAFPSLTGIVINENSENTNVICGEKYRLLYGKNYLTDILCGVTLRIAPQSFYQVNHDAAELLYKKAASLAGLTGTETLLDLYCGIGSIGLSMAKSVRRLVGIEMVPEAIECAKENAKASGIDNAFFFCGDAGKTEDMLLNAQKTLGEFVPDVVVLDPPRKGCDVSLIDYLCNRMAPPKIVYISCNPDTLARDTALLKDKYDIGAVSPVDLFPRTGHVESVVLLTRKLSQERGKQ